MDLLSLIAASPGGTRKASALPPHCWARAPPIGRVCATQLLARMAGANAMRRPEFLARQGRCPSGFLGSVVGRIMAHETAPENAVAVQLLQLKPTDHVLEVGFGHGRTVRAMVKQVPDGRVAGVDVSKEMLHLAT